MKPSEPRRRAAALGIPAGVAVRYEHIDRGGGWEMEWMGVPVDSKPPNADWPYHQERYLGDVAKVYQVWWMAAYHRPSGFRLERRWHPDLGREREWTATSRDGDFALLGTARGLFRHAGRRPAVRGAEEIREAHARLSRAAGKPPTAARLARELGMRTDTLGRYLADWQLNLPGVSTKKV